MPFPKQSEVEVPLLRILVDNGGVAKPKDVYPAVAKCFSNLSSEEQELRLESTPSVRKWWNLVQWVRQHLVEAGEIDGSTRGVWKITDAGRLRLKTDRAPQIVGLDPVGSVAPEPTLRDLSNRSRDEAKSRLLTELLNLTPTAFEHFCMALLEQLGY